MSGARDTSGPAFPNQFYIQVCEDTGITLRDYFAIHCFPAAYSKFPDGAENGWDTVADCAYSIADSMLKARQS
jgi:hypothetical protein